jgi:hypothetical protein
MAPRKDPFKKILDEMGKLHDRKAQDYGSDEDPLANIRASADFGIEPWIGATLRLNDKVCRLKKFATTDVLANESAENSLIDIAVYAVIALQLLREEDE